MPFTKKNSANNAICGLEFGFEDDALIIFASGNYGRFPTSNFVIEVATFDSSGKCINRENMLCTSRSGNQFTVTRAYEAVPINDDATSNTQTALEFVKTGTVIRQVVSKSLLDDIQDEIVDIPNQISDGDKVKLNNCTMQSKSADYTFTGSEENNIGFSTDTSSGDITYTLDPSLFDLTNGLFQFTFCKSTADTNKVIIDAGTGNTIDGAQTYEIKNQWETVTIKVATSTFCKVVATSGKASGVDINGANTFSDPVTGDKFLMYNASAGENEGIDFNDVKNNIHYYYMGLNLVTYRADQESSGWAYTTSFLCTKPTLVSCIGYYEDDAACQSHLQVSDDGISWSNYYTHPEDNVYDNDSRGASFIIPTGKYVRGACYTSSSSYDVWVQIVCQY